MKTGLVTFIGVFFFSASIHAATVVNLVHLSSSGPTLAPLAYIRFCLRYPDECEEKGEKDATKTLRLNPRHRAELDEINDRVNNNIFSQRKHESVAAETWVIWPAVGDCKDFAVTKRHLLREKGWPLHNLLLAEVVIPTGEHHLVLIVRTSEGDFVLDNLRPKVMRLAEIGLAYKWVRIESDSNPRFWNKVGEAI